MANGYIDACMEEDEDKVISPISVLEHKELTKEGAILFVEDLFNGIVAVEDETGCLFTNVDKQDQPCDGNLDKYVEELNLKATANEETYIWNLLLKKLEEK